MEELAPNRDFSMSTFASFLSRKLPSKKLLLLGAVFLAMLMSVFFIERKQYDLILAEYLSGFAEQNGLLVHLQEPRSHFWGICGKNVVLRPRNLPYPISLDSACLSVRPSALLTQQLAGQLNGVWHGGDLSTDFHAKADRSAIASGLLRDFSIAQFPAARLVGIEEGSFDVQLISASLEQGKLDRLELRISGKDIHKPLPTLLPQHLLQLAIPVSIPPITQLNLDLSLSMRGDVLRLSDIALQSSLVNLKGNLRFTALEPGFRVGKNSEVYGTFVIEMPQESKRMYGDLLRGFTQGHLGGDEKACTITLSGLARSPVLQYAPAQSFSLAFSLDESS